MNFAFLGKMIPEDMLDSVTNLSSHNMQDAANALQWNLYNGLCINSNQKICIINLLPIGSYPQYYKKPFVKKVTFSTLYSDNNRNVGFCNVKFIRNYFQEKNVKKELLRWCAEDENNRGVFAYTISAAFVSAVECAKKQYPTLKVCAIVADLPNMSALSSKHGRILKLFQKKMSNVAYSKLNTIDAFVLLTKQMADYMHITQPYCVVEGISTRHAETPCFLPYLSEKKIILYTGTLHKRFGVMNLVEAFRGIEGEQYELVLCGIGDSELEIQHAAEEDKRIKFLGQKTRAEILELQKKATVLVNPRQNNEEFTKYSFPSKNLEYLSSGRPLVAYKLDGIPDEYDEHIYYVEDNSIEALTKKLFEVCETPAELIIEHCQNDYNFVQTRKNEIEQTKIIWNMIKENGFGLEQLK